jgi:hypothetical protein
MPQNRIVNLSKVPERERSFKSDYGVDPSEFFRGIKMDEFMDAIMPKKGVHYFTPEEVSEFIKASTPVKGRDYFTKDEIEAWLKYVTPRKGTDYDDGKDGISDLPGPQGEPGRDADEDLIVSRVLSMIPKPEIREMPDIDGLRKELMDEIESVRSRKVNVTDIPQLNERLNILSAKVERNYGGHGGTRRTIAATLVSGGTYNLASPYPNFNELEVYVGGARLFYQSPNNDFTYVNVGGNRVSQITLNAGAQAQIAAGALLNVLGK